MLGVGDWHKFVPKDPLENLKYRRHLLLACRTDLNLRRGVRAACKADILFYINTFAVQYNPDNLGHEVEPFITYDFQDDAVLGDDVEEDGQIVHRWGMLECIEDQKDARWPKSRKMGASWLSLIVLDWLCLFHKSKMVGVMSRDEDSVDKTGDPSSLFWKVDFMHEHLPDWLKGKIKRKSMHIIYESTGSNMVGEANTVSAFVSGRATALLVDEFGQFKNGGETFDMTSDVSFCRIFVFTHREQSGMAYDLCFDPKYRGMREIKTHWSQHPERNRGLYRYIEDGNRIEILDRSYKFPVDFDFAYDSRPLGGPCPGLRSPWYDEECRRRSERDIAMNLDIDPRGATDKFFDPMRIQVLKADFCRIPLWKGNLIYDKERGLPIELQEDAAGKIELWINPKSKTLLPKMRAGAGADIAAGTGSSPSCLSIMNAATGEKVLEYRDALIFPNEFAVFCAALCRMFVDVKGLNPLLCWEIQGGSAFDRRLQEIGYSPCYVKTDEDAIGKFRDSKGKRGLNTQRANILPLMEEYRQALYDCECINRSEFALDETLRFVYVKSGVEYRSSRRNPLMDEGSGAAMHHGDIVKADAIAYKMIKQLGFEGEPEPENNVDPDWIHPGSLEGRMKLQNEEERDLVWA